MRTLFLSILFFATTCFAAPSFDVSEKAERKNLSEVKVSKEEINNWNYACEYFIAASTNFDEKNFEHALELIDKAIKEAPSQIYEVWMMHILKGDILRYLGKYEEARAAYAYVVTDISFRGQAWAQGIYKMGLAWYDEKEWLKAHSYFERVYVNYMAFEYWSSRAYLYDAKAFLKMGDTKNAKNILREYLYIAKIREGAIFQEAAAINRELLNIK